jgi:hypothetical protein
MKCVCVANLVCSCTEPGRSRDSVVGMRLATGLNDRGVGVRVPVGARIFSSPRRSDRLCGPPNLLSACKATGA